MYSALELDWCVSSLIYDVASSSTIKHVRRAAATDLQIDFLLINSGAAWLSEVGLLLYTSRMGLNCSHTVVKLLLLFRQSFPEYDENPVRFL